MAKSLEPQRFQGFFFCPDLAFFNSSQAAPYGLKRVNFSEWVNRWVKNGLIFHPLSCPFRTAEPSGQPQKRPILFLYKYEHDSKTAIMETSLFTGRLYGKIAPTGTSLLRHLRGRYFFSRAASSGAPIKRCDNSHWPYSARMEGRGFTPPEQGRSTGYSYQQAVPFRPTAWLLPRTCSTGTGLRRSP